MSRSHIELELEMEGKDVRRDKSEGELRVLAAFLGSITRQTRNPTTFSLARMGYHIPSTSSQYTCCFTLSHIQVLSRPLLSSQSIVLRVQVDLIFRRI